MTRISCHAAINRPSVYVDRMPVLPVLFNNTAYPQLYSLKKNFLHPSNVKEEEKRREKMSIGRGKLVSFIL